MTPRLWVVALVALVCPRWAETSPAPWVPAYASVVVYLDWAALYGSPVFLGAESALMESNRWAQIEELRELTGMDPLHDVWTVAYFTSSVEDGGARWGAWCYGAFDPERVIESLEAHGGGSHSEHRDIALYTVPSIVPPLASSTDEQVLAFPDGTTVLFGPAAQVRDMLDAGLGFAPLVSDRGELTEALALVTSGETLWIVGSHLPNRDGFPQIESFSLSARVGSHVRVRARAATPDAEAAARVSDLVRGMAAMRALQEPSDESLGALFESLEVETIGEVVDITFEVDAGTARDYLHLNQR